MFLGTNIKYLRRKNKMDQPKLATLLNKSSVSSISEWEYGKYYPKIETIVKISNIFNVSINDLIMSDLENNNISHDSIFRRLNNNNKDKVNSYIKFLINEQNKK